MPASERPPAARIWSGAHPDARDDELDVGMDYTGDMDELSAAGVTIRTRLGSLITASVPAASLDLVAALPGLRYIQLARRYLPLLDVSVPSTGASDMRSWMPPDWTGYTGKDVVVGAVDTGIDVNHRDFRNAQGDTRILCIWDQTTGTTGANHPSGYAYGTEWTAAQIDAGVCTQRDTSGHGTSVMGIAVGNGSATGNGWPANRYVGMAPEADIIAVKSTLSSTAIIDGMNYIKSRALALGKPCVINLSIGTQLGSHDGTDIVERAIGQIVGPGVVVCTATGNNGTNDPTRHVHAQLSVPTRNAEDNALLEVFPTRRSPFYMSLWYEGSDSIDIELISPNGHKVSRSTGAGTYGYISTPDGGIWIDNSTTGINSFNGDRECDIAVSNAAPGIWGLHATAKNIGSTGLCNVWIESGQNVFWASKGMNEGSCTMPGTAEAAITVGGYITKTLWTNPDGTQQGYAGTPGPFYTTSGIGPTRDGRQKPDLCVPSALIASSLSVDSGCSGLYIVEDGVHRVQSGTSMAVPHMSGAAALLLQRDPTATAAEIKNYVTSSALADGYTGSVPNTAWGYGKINLQSAIALTPFYGNIAGARLEPDGTSVKLPDQVVTAGLSQFSDRFYIESSDRSAGIQVRTGLGSGVQAQKGARVTVSGTIGLANGERAVLNPVVTLLGNGTLPDPLGMAIRSVGGASIGTAVPGVSGGYGPCNIGLLVRVCGRVTDVGSGYFHIDDGSPQDGSAGLKVSCVGLTAPSVGKYAVVTGISTLEWDGPTARPVVRVREQADLKGY